MKNYPDYSDHIDALTITALIVKLEQLKAVAGDAYQGDRYQRYVNSIMRHAIVDHLEERFGLRLCRATHL